MKSKELSIRLYGNHVGILKQTNTGGMTFTYSPSALQAVSIGMPIREEPYNEVHTNAFFGGLLPESETTRKIIGKKFGISHNNNFELLKAIGYDCAGAISCHAIDDDIFFPNHYPLTARLITENELYKHIVELPQKPLFIGIDGLRLSLAGAQDKAAVCLINNQIALAENGCPTTHILKPSFHQLEGLTINEYFCLKIAKKIGIPTPNSELRKIKDINFLLIERFDRRITAQFIERIHQEDFCQALGILSSKKYENEGGPGFLDCFNLLNETTQPAIDRQILALALVFNYFIRNMDAHGKNFSLLHHSTSQIRLAPLYDLICTQVYPNLTNKMAMKIGGKYDTNYLLPSHWEKMCKDINYRYLSMKDMIIKQSELILKAAAEEQALLIANDLEHPIIDKIMETIEKNIQRTINQFSK